MGETLPAESRFVYEDGSTFTAEEYGRPGHDDAALDAPPMLARSSRTGDRDVDLDRFLLIALSDISMRSKRFAHSRCDCSAASGRLA